MKRQKSRRVCSTRAALVFVALIALACSIIFASRSLLWPSTRVSVPERVMTSSDAFPLVARVSVMEAGRSAPHDFVLYSDGVRTAAIGNVSTYAGLRPARMIFDANGTLLYRPPDAVYDRPAAIKYEGMTKLLYGILPPKLILESATFNETSGLYSGSIPYYSPLIGNTSYYFFTILALTPDGFIKEYEVFDSSDLRHPSAVVSFDKITEQGPSAAVGFNYDVFSLPEGTEYRAPEDFGVVIA